MENVVSSIGLERRVRRCVPQITGPCLNAFVWRSCET